MNDTKEKKIPIYICRTTRIADEQAEAYDNNFFKRIPNSLFGGTRKGFDSAEEAINSVKGFPAHGVWIIYKVLVPISETISTANNPNELMLKSSLKIQLSDIEGFYAERVDDFKTFVLNKSFENLENNKIETNQKNISSSHHT